MPAPIPVYVRLLPPALAECGQLVGGEFASTLVDVFAEQLHSRFAHCQAMMAHLSDHAQKRCRKPLEAVSYYAGLLAGAAKPSNTKVHHGWTFTVDRCDELGKSLTLLESRIWRELARLTRAEERADEGTGEAEADEGDSAA